MKNIFFLSALILMVITSCDYPNFVHYTISNMTNDVLTCKYTYKDVPWGRKEKDTAIVLYANQVDTLFTYRLTSSSVYNPELTDTMKLISNIEMNRVADNAKNSKDIVLTKNWKFIKTGRNIARLEFTIN